MVGRNMLDAAGLDVPSIRPRGHHGEDLGVEVYPIVVGDDLRKLVEYIWHRFFDADLPRNAKGLGQSLYTNGITSGYMSSTKSEKPMSDVAARAALREVSMRWFLPLRYDPKLKEFRRARDREDWLEQLRSWLNRTDTMKKTLAAMEAMEPGRREAHATDHFSAAEVKAYLDLIEEGWITDSQAAPEMEGRWDDTKLRKLRREMRLADHAIVSDTNLGSCLLRDEKHKRAMIASQKQRIKEIGVRFKHGVDTLHRWFPEGERGRSIQAEWLAAAPHYPEDPTSLRQRQLAHTREKRARARAKRAGVKNYSKRSAKGQWKKSYARRPKHGFLSTT